jgi:DNA polymerase III subunit beta
MNVTSVQTATTVAVDAAALKAALTKLKPALGKSGAAVLGCIRVDATSSEVRLTASCLDDTLSTTIDGIVTDPGSVLVPYKLLNKLLMVHKKGTIEITGPGAEGVEPTVRCKNLSLSFEALDINEFPRSNPGVGRTVELNLTALADITAAISTDDSRPILCSVLVRDGSYVATDSYRLHIIDTPADTGEGFMLNRTGVQIAAKYKGTVTATVHERAVTIQLDETTTLVTRLVEGEFPPYKSLIPVNTPRWINLSGDFLADITALRKTIVADPSTPMRIAQGDGELNVSMGGPYDAWRSKVTTPGSSEVNIGFNPQYLVELLTGTTSNLLGAVDSLKPVVLREPAPEIGTDAQRVRLIMPVRVS